MVKSKDLVKGIGNYNATTKYYDDWSSTYDTSLKKWSYRAPYKASLVLKTYLTTAPKNILDLACGTGLFAESIIKFFPKTVIDGIDISKKILHKAKEKKIYKKLICSNFDRNILIKKKYDLTSCIGAMTYTKNPKKLMLNVHALTNLRGFFIFTHRIDLWKKQNYPKLLESLSNKWDPIFISRPILYLPQNKFFNDSIKIKIALLKKL